VRGCSPTRADRGVYSALSSTGRGRRRSGPRRPSDGLAPFAVYWGTSDPSSARRDRDGHELLHFNQSNAAKFYCPNTKRISTNDGNERELIHRRFHQHPTAGLSILAAGAFRGTSFASLLQLGDHSELPLHSQVIIVAPVFHNLPLAQA
jgi:hypothetical protein